MKSYRIHRRYPHGISKVWRALTTPELIERWLMPNDFQAVVGHRFTLRTEPGPGFDGIVHCQVLELIPESRMEWSWKGGPIDTHISFELQVDPKGESDATYLTVIHTGFRGFRSGLVGQFLRLGSRKIYGKNLTEVLDEMGKDETRPAPALSLDLECMGPKQRLLRALLSRITKKPSSH